MIIPVIIFVAFFYLTGSIIGIRNKSLSILFALNVFMWIGAFISAYLTWVAWEGRAYSENWDMFGFILVGLPFIIITNITILILLVIVRKWEIEKISTFRKSSLSLMIFLLLQLIIGAASA